MLNTICLLTNWYPTKQDPYIGIFFKEQAVALTNYYDFLIMHYCEHKNCSFFAYLFRRLRQRHFIFTEKHKERNTVEYSLEFWMPLELLLWERVMDFAGRHIPRFQRKKEKKSKILFRKLLREVFTKDLGEKIDLFYCVNAQRESAMLAEMANFVKKPYMVAEHAPFPWPGSIIDASTKEAIENADLFLAISYDKIRQVLLQNIKLENIQMIPNMVDEEQFCPVTKDDSDKKTLLITAAHSFFKNYDLFVKIMNRLVEITNVSFRVMIVGYGVSNGTYSHGIDEFEEQIRNSAFADKAELIPSVPHDKMPEIYQRADAFIMTSIQEGLPVSALEAASCGLPIFSTRCGGVEDFVDERMGRIYNIIDAESFADGLKDFLEKKIVFDQSYIRDYAVSHFGRDAFIQQFQKAVNFVIHH